MSADTTPAAEPMLLTIRQVAATLQLCEKSIWQLSKDGRLHPIRLGRAVRYSREDILALIEAAKEVDPGQA